jgi:hypothetical protein
MVDLRTCRQLVMVGCGAFPSTLLWLSDHFPSIHCVGLDIDPMCVMLASQLAKALGRANLRFENMDGGEFDYSVYVANHVAPKRTVLEKLLQYAAPGLHVVVREPTCLGELLAEPVRTQLPAGLVIQASGETSQTFFSYDLFLKCEAQDG